MPTTLPTDYQAFIHKSRYSRWIETEQRRETWNETVERYLTFMWENTPMLQFGIDSDIYRELRDAILNLEIMPSMRAMMTAGPALKRENIAGYNCSYVPIDNPRSFDEIVYILMNGTGVGFSVEQQFTNMLPSVPDVDFEITDDTISVADSKEGWARSFRDLISFLYTNRVPTINYDKIRPAGARLKTFGGRASGPQPLKDLFNFTIGIFKNARGRKLTSLECHDIVCKTGEVVVSGGVRRSALLSLSDLSDDNMRHAKAGDWWHTQPQRALSNNSVCYSQKPSAEAFMQEWLALVMSKSGERGIFNRVASQKQASRFERRPSDALYGTNPCSEIILKPNQFCNLTEIICKPTDTDEGLLRKVKLATILGTMQATLTDFHYLRKRWKDTTEEERLLGVSLTGIMDCALLNKDNNMLRKRLGNLRMCAVNTNKEWAEKLSIPASTAVTCVKPSGTVSQLTDTASGIHARHSEYYIRTIRGDNKDPLTMFMREIGIPWEADVMSPEYNSVFSFPVKSSKQAVTRKDMSAIQQLRMWNVYSEFWCEHKPSITVSVKDEEWVEVGAWCYKHFEQLSGVSFLPYSDHSYRQAPYQECTEEEYEKVYKLMPKKIDWEKLNEYETTDMTKSAQELACSSGFCEITDI
jgi:ribonucleoside-triphosphate reductase (thioredoxin)